MLSRRDLIKTVALGAGAVSLNAMPNALSNTQKAEFGHSVCRWCYQSIPLEEFADKVKDLGMQSIELLQPNEWPIVQKRGLTCAVATGSFASLTDGFNKVENHEKLFQPYMDLISQAADAGIPHVICFSGNRNGLDDQQGLENCAVGLDKLVKHAEQAGVVVVMELLNSKVDHKDYQCDHTDWGVQLVEKLGSPNFKLLYDIYHMQIMEGDIIATIRKNKDYIAHFHTGGVPGRNEISDAQELNYAAIMRAITETGFKGYVAQEFIPTYEDPIAALKEGITICSV